MTLPARSSSLFVACLAIPLFAACGSSDGSPADDAGTTDVSSDSADTSDAGDGSGAEPDAGDDVADGGDPDVDAAETTDTAELPDSSGLPCELQRDCPAEEVCVNAVCTIVPCPGDESQWNVCETTLNELEPDLGRFATCHERRCHVACQTDQDCAEGESCTDFGECVVFDGSLTGIHPGGDAPAAFQAGFSNVLWNYPVGTALGGYGERAAVNDGRYDISLRASAGQFHGIYIRGAAFDTGERQFITIRIPTIFTGFALHEDVSRALQERTGRDWRSSLIISSTHTHSGPCSHWHLPGKAAATLGSFGIGEFSQYFYDWILESTTQAAFEALDALQPAQIGWQIVEAYDVDDSIGSDRWNQTPPFDDNRLLLVRVDDMEGIPLGVMFSFAAHGTDNDTDYVSGDALGGVEYWLEYELGRQFGRFVPTMFLNQNSGSMSPRGDRGGHRFPQTMERIGWAFTDKVLDTLLGIDTAPQLEIDAHMHRFPITYDALGYERDAFAGDGRRPIGGEYHFGGISCSAPEGGDQDFETFMSLEDLVCAGALQFLLFNQPAPEFMKSQVMVGQWRQEGREDLTWVTTPGELAEELSWDILRELRDAHGVDPLNAWTFAYANDHLLYILPTNTRGPRPPFPGLTLPHPDNTGFDELGLPLIPGAPDDYPQFAMSYLQGGYEASMSPWGPNLGDYLVHQVSNAWTLLQDPGATVDSPPTFPVHFTYREQVPFRIDTQPAATAGTLLTDMPETLPRLTPVEIAWYGGDPGAEAPQVPVVTLQQNVDGGWQTVTLPNTRDYTNLEPRFMTRFREGENDGEYVWIARWEEMKDFPAGTYRFTISGHTWNGTARVPYDLTTREFEILPIEFAQPDVNGPAVTVTTTTVSGTLSYPASQRMEFLDLRRDRGAVNGHFRMRHPWVPVDIADPMFAEDLEAGSITVTATQSGDTVELTAADLTVVTADEAFAGRAAIPVTRFSGTFPEGLGPGTWTVTVTATDAWGNTGTWTGDVTL